MSIIYHDPRYKDINPSLSDWTNSLSVIGPVISGYDTVNDIAYNTQTPLSEDVVFDEALRGTAQDRHVINQLYDLVATGNGLWGKSSAEREIEEGVKHARNINTDFSGVNSISTLQNVYNSNTIPQPLQALSPTKDNGRSMSAALAINPILEQKQRDYITGFYDQVGNINQKQLRQNMMNYFAEGGSLEELNGVVKVGNGNTHEQNPYDGVQMGIAPDNLPNLVEEGEIVYNDYVYSNRLKPSKSLLKQYNLPDKYAGKSFAEIGDKLQKESEDRPNDPISKTTLDEWMLRLQNAQEDYKAKVEERRLAKIVNNMSDEEKAALLSSLEQPMAQPEGIDLSQPMYAKGGKIYIKPENRGKFTALKKRTGKSTSWFKAHGTPAQKKMATFALNAKKWSHKHDLGDYLFLRNNNSNTPWYDFNTEVRDNPLFPYLVSEGNTQVSPIDNNSNINIRYDLTHAYDEPNMVNPIWRQGLFTNNLSEPTPVDYVTRPPYKPYPEQTESNDTSNDNVNTDLLARRLGESLRYAPAVGAQLGAITAALQPKDYTLANRLEDLASEFRPMSAPHIGGYRRYTPYDVNLGDVENIGLTAAALSANRGQNRATQGALNTAVLAKAQEASAKRNLAAQQANEANRLATDQYNLGIDQFNAQRDSAYDQLNQQILANRINMLGQAAQARDASRTAWASNINTTAENAFNQLGNVGRDNWNRNQRDFLLKALGREGLLELIKLGYFKS